MMDYNTDSSLSFPSLEPLPAHVTPSLRRRTSPRPPQEEYLTCSSSVADDTGEEEESCDPDDMSKLLSLILSSMDSSSLEKRPLLCSSAESISSSCERRTPTEEERSPQQMQHNKKNSSPHHLLSQQMMEKRTPCPTFKAFRALPRSVSLDSTVDLDWDLERIGITKEERNTSKNLLLVQGIHGQLRNEEWDPISLTTPDSFTPPSISIREPPVMKKYMMPSLFSTTASTQQRTSCTTTSEETATVVIGEKRRFSECSTTSIDGDGVELDLVFSSGSTNKQRKEALHEEDSTSHDGSSITTSSTTTSSSIGENLPPSSTTTSANKRFKAFHEDKWNEHFKSLQQYKATHGDCHVPHTYPKDILLGRWVKRQRRQYKLYLENNPSSTMTPERINQLNEEGFIWDSHDVAWIVKYNMLLKFQSLHGHCCVPSSSKKTTPYSPLATWVKCQRRLFRIKNEGKKKCALTDERVNLLNSIGFAWEVR